MDIISVSRLERIIKNFEKTIPSCNHKRFLQQFAQLSKQTQGCILPNLAFQVKPPQGEELWNCVRGAQGRSGV